MDESAEWRMRYDSELDKAAKCYRELQEVLPSLEVSFQTSRSPSRLQEFLVRMDVINKTASESFQVHQLSCVGDQWELALLQPIDSVMPLKFLMAGQALSYFFKLKNHRARGSTEDDISSLATSGRADVSLLDSDSTGLFDASIPPLNLFHHQERLHQERHKYGNGSTVDFILISKSWSDSSAGLPRTAEVFSHYTCHCSPIWWLMDGPRSVSHDFAAAAFCEINLSMTIYNNSEDVVSVRISTFDSTPSVNPGASGSGDEVGWHHTSNPSEAKVTSPDVT